MDLQIGQQFQLQICVISMLFYRTANKWLIAQIWNEVIKVMFYPHDWMGPNLTESFICKINIKPALAIKKQQFFFFFILFISLDSGKEIYTYPV